MQVKAKKLVTVPTLSMKGTDTAIIRIEEAFHIGKEMPVKAGQKPMEPATVGKVLNYATGEYAEFIYPAVVSKNLDEHYPDQKYVGLSFQLEKLPRKEGKAYDGYRITEVEVTPDEGASAPTNGKKK